MLRNVILKELMKLDVLGTLQQLVESAKLHLKQGDKNSCMTELDKLEEYLENFQDISMMQSMFEKHAIEQGLENDDILEIDRHKRDL
ncbi:MAG: hypothetical protein ACJBCI_07030 [Candidatus Tisiphia sp.]|jgi:hypothetical protein|uniref:hypothetical protein n=1 Tax=unclassified Candidatus Tisiphia TaxID=2996318 RepID=UPI001E7F6BD5|nr:MAG: hypothetical protein LF884_03185 [Rickettsia endosymbiont of Cimex lectularius]